MSGMAGTGLRPAWSHHFAPENLRTLDPTLLPSGGSRAWAWGGGSGRGVRVAVIDSGVDADHPAVAGRVHAYVGAGGPTGDLVVQAVPHDDAFGHGTACAGIILSLAPECEIYSIKVLGQDLKGRGAAFVAALRWAIDNGMHICNLSLGSTKPDFSGLLHELADLAYFRNVMLVSAANNLSIPSFPSVYASVISVASHSQQDPYCFYYNPHPPVEFGALGVDVRVAWKQQGWVTTTGNSFAAPHITGIVARILSRYPGLTPFEVKTILRATASNVRGDRVNS